MTPHIPHFVQVGGNRGARGAADHLERAGVRVTQVDIADPKPGRAVALASQYARKGARATPHEQDGSLVLRSIEPHVPAVIAIDDLGPVVRVLESGRERDLLIQGVGQGGRDQNGAGSVFGVQVASLRGRTDVQEDAALLFGAIGRSAGVRSSAVMRTDAVSAMRLHAARDAVSLKSASQLPFLEHTRSEDVLTSLFWGGEAFPLVVARSDARTARDIDEHSLSLARGRRQAVGLVLAPDHAVVSVVDGRRGGRGFLFFRAEFPRPQPPPPPQPSRLTFDMAPFLVAAAAVAVAVAVAAAPVAPAVVAAAAFTD